MRLLHHSRSTWMTLMLPVHPWSALGSNPDSNGATCAPDRRYAFAVEIRGVWRVWVSDTAKANRPKSTRLIYALQHRIKQGAGAFNFYVHSRRDKKEGLKPQVGFQGNY